MLASIPGSTFLALCIALVPAAFVWWTGRALACNPEDPLLPEKLLALRLRARTVLAFVWAFASVLWWHLFSVIVPLMILARALAAYPLRRKILGETWQPWTYLWFFGRLTLAFFGFWLLLMWTPQLSLSAGRADWAVSCVLAGVLLLWNRHFTFVTRRLLGARPIANDELAARFARLAERAGLARPLFEVAPVAGGVFVNAVALPSLRTPAVVFTSTVIERFDADEIEAISAHELAHIEHYNQDRLRRLNASVLALIAAAAAVAPVVRVAAARAAGGWLVVIWVIAVVGFLLVRARSRQKDETASDLRAVEWTGAPEALVSALVKLHTLGRLPRRWETQFERNATHPSLARRIQAIRSAAGQTSATLDTPAVFVTAGHSVAFHPEHLRWSEGDAVTHSVAYTHLTELRLDVRREKTPRLIAIERGGRRWELPVDTADAARAQQVLDVVDGQLAHAAPTPTYAGSVVRLIAAVAALAAVSASYMSAAIPALLALIQPSRSMCVAAGAGAFAAAAVAVRSALAHGTDGYLWAAILLCLSGAVMSAVAWSSRHDDSQPSSSRPLVVLGLLTASSWIALFVAGTSPVRLYQAAQSSAIFVVCPAALAAALAMSRPRFVRLTSVPIALACAGVFVVGTRLFVESASDDPFVVRGRMLSAREFAGDKITEAKLPAEASDLRVSPSGHAIAFADDSDEDEQRTFFVGSFGGPYERLAADDVLFVNDDEMLVVEYGTGKTVIRKVRREAVNAPLWERTIDGMMRVSLQSSGTWRALGTARHEVIELEGRSDGSTAGERHWPRGAADAATNWVEPVAASATTVLMQERIYQPNALRRMTGRYPYLYPFVYLLVPDAGVETRVWSIGPAGVRPLGTTVMNLECHAGLNRDAPPVCVAFDGRRSTVFRVGLDRGSFEAVASLSGRIDDLSDQATAWLTARWNGRPIMIRQDGSEAWTIRTSRREWTGSVAATDRFIAVIASGVSGPSVSLYSSLQSAERSTQEESVRSRR